MKKQDNNLIKSKKILFLIISILLLVVFILVNKNIEKEKVKRKEKEIKANDIMLKPISETKGKNENVTNIVPETKNNENNNKSDKDNNESNIETIETEEEFKEKIIDKKEKAIVYYYAKWCGPCKTMKNIIQELSSENINIYKVDVENKNMAKNIYSAGIRAIPTYIYYNNGIEVSREYGIVSKNTLKEKYEKLNN